MEAIVRQVSYKQSHRPLWAVAFCIVALEKVAVGNNRYSSATMVQSPSIFSRRMEWGMEASPTTP